MARYLVEVRQEITIPITVDADNVNDAQKRAVLGLGEFGDQSFGELAIAAVRELDPINGVA
ncbi:MAG: hypothetical protein ACI9BO_001690 [Zhongshania sp.]|jgi:hypothetical protein